MTHPIIAQLEKEQMNKEIPSFAPGDTIVVPLDAERMRPLPLWTAVTTIVFNLAVAVAAVAGI